TSTAFFARGSILIKSGAKHLLDIRLNNNSQLAGFTKRDDLRYFLLKLAKMEYHVMQELAPDESILKEYRADHDWAKYEIAYNKLIEQRRIERYIPFNLIQEGIVLLCSEAEPIHCHRRLAAEYLAKTISVEVNIEHL
ncbi:DUF488 family protein, partial [Chloroflexota bacterium]